MARRGGLRYEVSIDATGLARRAGPAASRAIAAAASEIARRAAANAPRRTGALAASARVETTGVRAHIAFGAPYARVQHARGGFLAAALDAPDTARTLAQALGAALGL